MTTGMPELGSKISLISKADIRYEGRLFTVDPQECTIALASVRSFGTEDRDTPYPVPAQNQVYDYILFRGSDIKDIQVIGNIAHPQPLNDPAIMQLSVPPSLGNQPFQGHPVLGPMAPQMGQFAATSYGGMGAVMGSLGTAMGGMQRNSRGLGGSKPSELIVGPGPQPPTVLSPPIEPPQTAVNHDLIGGSRSTTPASLTSRKSPTIDQGVQAGGSDKKVVKPIQPPGQRNQQRRQSKERRSSRGEEGQQQSQNRPNKQGYHGGQSNYQSQGGYHGGRDHGQGSYQNREQGHGSHQGRDQNQASHQGREQSQGGFQNYQGQRGGWTNRGGPPMRTRGRPRGGYRNQPNGQSGTRQRNTLKFENDYDFEQANTEFEELRSQLGKLKMDEASSVSTKSEVNGDVDKKDDSGNETGAGEPEQEDDQEVYYDKTKSFFDKISCEAVERAKGKSQRTDWRVERKLNSETFGVAATRRGNFRGRGGYRGMGYRGGYRNNYRHPQRRDQPQQSSSQNQQGNPSEQNQKQKCSNVEKDSSSMSADVTCTPAEPSEQAQTKIADGFSGVPSTSVA
ncbi:LSM14 family protein trailer hitch isoform X2 [Leptinotarsa decemlineata]|uniref:LSM14 family protein trailer hitch isoform X2 n=1 Tax=Leptinotarsa decemlineata TaxID=7539 RepID=UPI003D30C331